MDHPKPGNETPGSSRGELLNELKTQLELDLKSKLVEVEDCRARARMAVELGLDKAQARFEGQAAEEAAEARKIRRLLSAIQ